MAAKRCLFLFCQPQNHPFSLLAPLLKKILFYGRICCRTQKACIAGLCGLWLFYKIWQKIGCILMYCSGQTSNCLLRNGIYNFRHKCVGDMGMMDRFLVKMMICIVVHINNHHYSNATALFMLAWAWVDVFGCSKAIEKFKLRHNSTPVGNMILIIKGPVDWWAWEPWMGDIGYRGRGCVTAVDWGRLRELRVWIRKRIWSDDGHTNGQIDRLTEFPLVDSTPVKGAE